MKSFWIKGFFRSWHQQKIMQFATLSVLTGTFVVFSLFLLIHKNLENIFLSWGESVKMSVFLSDEISTEDKSKVQNFLETTGHFEKIEFISKEQALDKFIKQQPKNNHILENPEFGNPLPASFEATLKATNDENLGVSILKSVSDSVSILKGTEGVYYGEGWVENYASVFNAFKLSSWFFILVLLVGSLFVIGNSIRNAISHRRDEIEILELVGATPEMIRLPYIIEGSIMGFLASFISLLLTYILYKIQSAVVSAELEKLTMGAHISFLSGIEIFSILILGLLFGSVGAWFCVYKMTSGWSFLLESENF